MAAVDKRIDFTKLSDNIADCEANVFAHLKVSGVSREWLRPSKHLPGTPFSFLNTQNSPLLIQTKASVSSLSTNTGGTALRSLACA